MRRQRRLLRAAASTAAAQRGFARKPDPLAAPLLRAAASTAAAQRGFARKPDPLTPPPPPSSFAASAPSEHFSFEVLHASAKAGSRARVGRLHTPHGVVDTPGFVPVGTNGALKAVTMADADAVGMQLMFCNTYHLMLQPGTAPVEAAGGLHAYIGRPRGPLITDSGGFQVRLLPSCPVQQRSSSTHGAFACRSSRCSTAVWKRN